MEGWGGWQGERRNRGNSPLSLQTAACPALATRAHVRAKTGMLNPPGICWHDGTPYAHVWHGLIHTRTYTQGSVTVATERGREWQRSAWCAHAPHYKCIHIWVKGWWEGDGTWWGTQVLCRKKKRKKRKGWRKWCGTCQADIKKRGSLHLISPCVDDQITIWGLYSRCECSLTLPGDRRRSDHSGHMWRWPGTHLSTLVWQRSSVLDHFKDYPLPPFPCFFFSF